MNGEQGRFERGDTANSPDGAARVLVVGVGNAYRSDDGAGREAARRVGAAAWPGVAVREASGEGASLMESWDGFERVYLIDATCSGAPPGTIHRFDAAAGPMPVRFFHYSTHVFSLAEAVELGRALGRLPPELVVYGIEGHSFEAGQRLSAPVQEAVNGVVSRLREDICGALRAVAGLPDAPSC